VKTITELFEHELALLYDAEHKILKALLRMASKCANPELVEVLQEYQSISQRKVERLESVFKAVGRQPSRVPCAGINGLITEFTDFLDSDPAPDILDVYAVESARRVERYAICAYQALITLSVAQRLDAVTETLAASLADHNFAGDGFKALSINLTEKLMDDAPEKEKPAVS
jgi:ferritin-like metal-binding protein YciE